MLEKLDNVVFSNDDMDLNDIDFFSDGMIVVTIDPNYISLDDDYFDEDNPISIVPVRLIAWCNRFK